MAGTEIRSITARQVYTNRGNPGVEAVVTTENGATGRAMCTSGISIGTHEIHFDFDGGERFRGKGVLGAVRNVNEIIAPALKGLDAANQRLIDRTMLDIVQETVRKVALQVKELVDERWAKVFNIKQMATRRRPAPRLF